MRSWPPVDADADQDEGRQKESERAEKSENPAGRVASYPLHSGRPADLDGHEKERHLQRLFNDQFSTLPSPMNSMTSKIMI